MAEREFGVRDVDVDRPNTARVYDYLIGGKLNYAMDRAFAEKLLERLPRAGRICRLNRSWLHRVVRFGAEQGVRQFLDIGSGMPSAGHVHEIAQAYDPDARVVYVDNEPVAIAHSEIVLDGNENAAMVAADAEAPEDVLGHPVTRRLLDYSLPIMVLFAAFVHFIPPGRDLVGLIARYRGVLVPGSYIAVSSVTNEDQDDEMFRAVEMYQDTTNPLYLRDRAQITALMAGLEIVEPGVVFTSQWRPADDRDDTGERPEEAGILAVVGRVV